MSFTNFNHEKLAKDFNFDICKLKLKKFFLTLLKMSCFFYYYYINFCYHCSIIRRLTLLASARNLFQRILIERFSSHIPVTGKSCSLSSVVKHNANIMLSNFN